MWTSPPHPSLTLVPADRPTHRGGHSHLHHCPASAPLPQGQKCLQLIPLCSLLQPGSHLRHSLFSLHLWSTHCTASRDSAPAPVYLNFAQEVFSHRQIGFCPSSAHGFTIVRLAFPPVRPQTDADTAQGIIECAQRPLRF